MLPIEIRDVTLTYDTPGGKVPGVKDVSFDIDGVRVRLHPRTLRLRQVDLAEHDRRFPRARLRRNPHRRQDRHRPRHGPRRGVSGFRPAVSLAHRARQRVVRAGNEGRSQRGARDHRARAVAPGQAGEVHQVLPASSVRRHATAGRHRPRARVQSGGAADGRAVRGARCAHPRRHAAAAGGGVAGNPQDDHLRDAQRRGGGLSGGPRRGDVAASWDSESRDQDSAATPARSAQRRIRRKPEGIAALPQPRRERKRAEKSAVNGKSKGGST